MIESFRSPGFFYYSSRTHVTCVRMIKEDVRGRVLMYKIHVRAIKLRSLRTSNAMHVRMLRYLTTGAVKRKCQTNNFLSINTHRWIFRFVMFSFFTTKKVFFFDSLPISRVLIKYPSFCVSFIFLNENTNAFTGLKSILKKSNQFSAIVYRSKCTFRMCVLIKKN